MSDIVVQKRIDNWKDRLLDLSLRNRQLNFLFNKSVIKLHPQDSSANIQDLLNQKMVSIIPEKELKEALGTSSESSTSFKKLNKKLVTTDTIDRLAKTYINLFRSSEKLELERGYRSLYLSIGFLSWYESESSDTERFCPTILMPIKLSRPNRSNTGFNIELCTDDDALCLNESMIRKFQVEFGVNFPNQLQSEFEVDEDLTDLDEQQDNKSISPLEMLNQYFDSVDELLKTTSALKRWSLHRNLWGISLLDFAKGVMWRDLSALLNIKQSPIVSQLLNGGSGSVPACNITTIDRLDDPPKEQANRLYPLLPFDPSQQQAILAAVNGGTFVLQGPPGTGKSQTITQMIAQLISQGKKVLFVSEKRAALDVVARRLTQLKLDPFFLNAHSHKNSKRELIDDLWQPMRLKSDLINSQNWNSYTLNASYRKYESAATRYQDLKTELNQYTLLMSQATTWHGVVDLPQTNYELLEAVVKHKHLRKDQGIAQAEKTIRNQVGLSKRLSDLLGTNSIDLDVLVSRYGTLEKSIVLLSSCQHTRWTPSWSTKLDEILESYEKLMTWIAQKWADFNLPKLRLKDLKKVSVFLELIIEQDPAHPLFNKAKSNTLDLKQIEEWSDSLSKLNNLTKDLSSKWKAELWLHPDLVTIRGAFIKWAESLGILRFFFLYGKRKTLLRLRNDQSEPTDSELRDDLIKVSQHQEMKEDFKQVSTAASNVFGISWQGEKTDPQMIQELVHWSARVSKQYTNHHDNSSLIELFNSLVELRIQRGPQAIINIQKAVKQWLNIHQQLKQHGQFTFSEVYQNGSAPAWKKWAQVMLTKRGELQRLCALNSDLALLENKGWGGLSHLMKTDKLTASKILPLIKLMSFDQAWSELCEKHEDIATFSVTVRESRISEFAKIDQDISALAQAEVINKLFNKLPDLSNISSRRSRKKATSYQDRLDQGLAILKREFEKKSRHKPLRELFKTCAEAITLLKPCVCMSPLSVAHYLPIPIDNEPALFDVIIFDEASQLRPWDAIGAIARANQAVIVGDSKQLPPTNFFQSSSLDEAIADEATEDDLEDLESILDEALAARLKELTLRWHYRSKHESLIAFSNFMYYQNQLHTFPSSDLANDQLGIRLVKVEGTYDRGKSRTNQIEAQKVVSELFTILGQKAPPTVGIVTFSQAQQTLIEDLIDAERLKHPELEGYFLPDYHEPVFVKNLETVQGDERDIILFSICYGPDLQGRIYYNFGPLNRGGGERRLNVAVTRARKAMAVISSMTGDMLDARKLKATGALHLKTFLNYAQKGAIALDADETINEEAKTESPFEAQVLQFLKSKGWEVVPQVGVAGYRIDLGVVDPKNPGRFLLGVECDGATYHSSRVARERDILRQQVLESLGWTIHRIWSTDWWIDPRPQMVKLHEKLTSLSS